MPRWLLLDYGQVLCTAPPADEWDDLRRTAGHQDGPTFSAAYWEHRPAYDRGDLTPEEYWGRVAPGAPLEALRPLDVRIWLHPCQPAVDAAGRAAARGWPLALFSNAPVEVAEAIDDLDWLHAVSRRFYSCRINRVKPEPEAYLHVLAELGVDPTEVVFFDDRADNVVGARLLGIEAHVFSEAGQLDAL